MNRNRFKPLLLIACLIAATCTALALTEKQPEPGPGNAVTTGDSTVTFSGRLTRNKIIRNGDGTVALALTMTARDTDEAAPVIDIPVDLVVVLDRSGSMDGEKISDARRAILDLIELLGPNDRFALISYATEATRHSGLLPATPANRVLFTDAVRNIRANGGTNLGSGLNQALTLLHNRRTGRNIGRIILISDGLANHGITDPFSLGQMAARAVPMEAAVSTVGVGLDFNEQLLTTIADQGAGSYTFLETPEGFADTFRRELLHSRTAAATGIEVRIPLKDGIRVLDAAGFPIEYRDNAALFRPGDLRTGQSRNLYVTLKIPTRQKQEFAITGVSLRYRRNDTHHTLTLADTFTVVCVADRALALASIDKGVWEGKVLQEDYSRLKEKVAEAIRRGDIREANRQIQCYRAKKEEINEVVGSGAVADNLAQDLRGLESQVRESFTGPPAAAAAKQKKNAKIIQYQAYESRRAK